MAIALYNKHSNLVQYRVAMKFEPYKDDEENSELNPNRKKVEQAITAMLNSGLKYPYLRFIASHNTPIAKCIVYKNLLGKRCERMSGGMKTLDEVITLFNK